MYTHEAYWPTLFSMLEMRRKDVARVWRELTVVLCLLFLEQVPGRGCVGMVSQSSPARSVWMGEDMAMDANNLRPTVFD